MLLIDRERRHELGRNVCERAQIVVNVAVGGRGGRGRERGLKGLERLAPLVGLERRVRLEFVARADARVESGGRLDALSGGRGVLGGERGVARGAARLCAQI